jgi:hypothetical protein
MVWPLHGKAQAARLPGCDAIKFVEGADHALPFEQPQAAGDMLLWFLRQRA